MNEPKFKIGDKVFDTQELGDIEVVDILYSRESLDYCYRVICIESGEYYYMSPNELEV